MIPITKIVIVMITIKTIIIVIKTITMVFFLYIQFTLFQTKRLQSPGTYISKRSWDPSQKATRK